MGKLPELQWIQTFVGYCQSESMVAAARQLSMTQPAITQHIQRLEHALERPLFSKKGKARQLTRYGESCLALFSKSLADLQTDFSKLQSQWIDDRYRPFKIASREGFLNRIAPGLEHEGDVSFVNCSSHEATDLVENGKADIAISRVPSSLSDFESSPVFSSKGVLIANLHAKGFSGDDKSFVEKNPFLAFSDPHPYVKSWLTGLGVQKLSYHRICSNWQILIRWVTEGRGITVIPDDLFASNPALKKAVQSCPLPTDAFDKHLIFLVYPKNMKNTLEQLGLYSYLTDSSRWQQVQVD